MTGFDCVCEAIGIFEESLREREFGCRVPIRSVAELAQRAGYSIYHFTRLFSAVTGVTPKDYLSGRILTEAARDVAESKKPLGQVALDVGFVDYESFSRAFKRQFALPPSQTRRLGSLPDNLVSRLVPQRPGALHLASPEPESLQRSGFTVAGLSFYIGPETVSFHTQWATFLKAQSRVASRTTPETFFQVSSWLEGDAISGMSVLCGLETEPEATQEPFFTIRHIPEALYLRFVHAGDIAAVGSTYRYIYEVWLARHEVRPAASWEFQRYADGGLRTEIWIPVPQ